MNIRLHVKKELHEEKQSILNLMPCKIHADRTAKVSTCFAPYVHKLSDEHYISSFRGYPLQGKKITIPSGYKGIIFIERKKPNNDYVQRNLYSKAVFSEFTYWNYDKIPSKNHAIEAALDWIDVAEALHETAT